MSKRRRLTPLAAFLILSGCMILTACDKAEPKSAQQQAPEVGVITVKSEALPITTELPGRTVAYRIAEVRPQVSGIILKRNFIEGSDIKAGQSLYQIDPATYQAAYDSAKGNLAQAQANAKIATLTVDRYKPLLGTGYVSKQTYDQAIATQSQTIAAVAVAKASVETARINLVYTKVTSPIDGRIGKSSVSEGALVQNAQATALATVQQLDPIYVDVTQSSDDFIRLRNELASGKLQQTNSKANARLLTANGSEYAQTGVLEFSDVTVDETTGSITLRAIFPNPDHQLLPGMFVRARLESGVKPDAILIPQQAVSHGPTGQAITLVVNQDNKVEIRTITTERAIGDKWLVTAGLNEGERIIVSGTQRAKAGITVTPRNMAENKTTDSTASQPSSAQKQS